MGESGPAVTLNCGRGPPLVSVGLSVPPSFCASSSLIGRLVAILCERDAHESWNCRAKGPIKGPAETRTRIFGFKVQGANHYTTGPQARS